MPGWSIPAFWLIVAEVLETLYRLGVVIGGLHAANSVGSFGTDNGLAGAIVAMVAGLISLILDWLVSARSRRLEPNSHSK